MKRRMKREYIADFTQGNHGENVMPKQELIRCEDCKYYFRDGHVRCWNIRGMHYPVEPYEFCSRAERKEE